MTEIEWQDVDPTINWEEVPTGNDYYEALQVSRNASAEVLRAAYRALMEKYHPDRQPPTRKAWAEEMTRRLNEAYAVLSDADKKRGYDWRLRARRGV
jgi:molecular chaperone DnaJ